jgi:hypothetical protein
MQNRRHLCGRKYLLVPPYKELKTENMLQKSHENRKV